MTITSLWEPCSRSSLVWEDMISTHPEIFWVLPIICSHTAPVTCSAEKGTRFSRARFSSFKPACRKYLASMGNKKVSEPWAQHHKYVSVRAIQDLATPQNDFYSVPLHVHKCFAQSVMLCRLSQQHQKEQQTCLTNGRLCLSLPAIHKNVTGKYAHLLLRCIYLDRRIRLEPDISVSFSAISSHLVHRLCRHRVSTRFTQFGCMSIAVGLCCFSKWSWFLISNWLK